MAVHLAVRSIKRLFLLAGVLVCGTLWIFGLAVLFLTLWNLLSAAVRFEISWARVRDFLEMFALECGLTWITGGLLRRFKQPARLESV
jgi:hypothetical protein